MRMWRAAVALALLAWPGPVPAADGPYRLLKESAIGGEGGWDYLSVDPVARRPYVSHATKGIVVDIDKGAVVGEIAPAPGVHGIAVAPDLGRGFVSNSGRVRASVPIGPGAAGAGFDPGTGLALASSSDGTLTVARPEGQEGLAVVQTLVTPKRARTMTLDPKTHRLYVAAAEPSPGSFKVVAYEMTGLPGR